MQISNTIDVTSIIQSGKRIYKDTWKAFLKYAFLSVFFSYIVSIYVGIFDTLFYDNEVIYIVGLILLLLLYFPIIYYSVRFTVTNVGKFKAIALDQPFDYKLMFKKSKDKFWRIFVILLLKFIIKAVMIGAVVLPGSAVVANIFPELIDLTVEFQPSIPMFIMSFFMLLGGMYLLARLEFATIVVYWDVETKLSDITASFQLTRYEFWKKLKLMIIGHIPGFIMSGISLVYIFSNLQDTEGYIRWVYIGLSLIVNTVFFSWIYSIYFPLFESLRCFDFDRVKTIDEEGREWMSF